MERKKESENGKKERTDLKHRNKEKNEEWYKSCKKERKR